MTDCFCRKCGKRTNHVFQYNKEGCNSICKKCLNVSFVKMKVEPDLMNDNQEK